MVAYEEPMTKFRFSNGYVLFLSPKRRWWSYNKKVISLYDGQTFDTRDTLLCYRHRFELASKLTATQFQWIEQTPVPTTMIIHQQDAFLGSPGTLQTSIVLKEGQMVLQGQPIHKIIIGGTYKHLFDFLYLRCVEFNRFMMNDKEELEIVV